MNITLVQAVSQTWFGMTFLTILLDMEFKLDVKNQAGVHIWYENKYGFPIKPYNSLVEEIDSWQPLQLLWD